MKLGENFATSIADLVGKHDRRNNALDTCRCLLVNNVYIYRITFEPLNVPPISVTDLLD